MKAPVIIAAALSLGTGYAGTYGYDLEVQAYEDRMRGDFRSTEILTTLRDIEARQRQAEYYRYQSELERLRERPHPLFIWPTDCE